MHEMRLRGRYFEMGEQIGEYLRRDRHHLPRFSEEKLTLGMKYEEEVMRYAPELLDELRGIAQGCGVSYEALVAHELSPFRLQPSCLVIAISGEHTKSGLPMLARSQEWTEESAKDLTICQTSPDGKIRSLGFTYHWLNLSRFGGTNEEGLAIASATTAFENTGPGVMFNVAKRWILDNCSTVGEACEFLEQIPKVWGTAYLMIDKENSIAKVEAHRQRTKVTRIKNGFCFVTLRFDSPEMDQYNDRDEGRAEWVAETYATRSDFLTGWFAQNRGRIDEALAADVLRDHEHQMCTHDFDGHVHYGTSWSWVLSIGEDEATVCAGPPCKNAFKKIPMFPTT